MMSRQPSHGAVHRLTSKGVSLWLDGLDRSQLTSGEFKRLLRDVDVTGVTTTPGNLGPAIQAAGDWYATDLADARHRCLDAAAAGRELGIDDVRKACDELRPIFDATDGLSGYASIEVDPRFADDSASMVADARSLTHAIRRPNLLVTIPATHNGLVAIESCVTDGIHVNVTLIFGLRRYAEVIDAFMDGLERRRAAGGDVHGIASVASLFLSHLDAEVGKRLTDSRVHASLHGRVAVANARLAWRLFQQSLTLPRWVSLAAAGGRPQRLLWASTATPDLSLPDTHYVTELAVQDVIVSVPATTLRALEDIEDLPASWAGDELDARAVFEMLETAGIDYDELVLTLERTGVHNRENAWKATIDTVERLWR